MHITPASLPSGIPGNGDEIDNAIQHAPHSERQIIINVIKWLNGTTAQRSKGKKINLFHAVTKLFCGAVVPLRP
jgi:hypothetical protein